jgi:hypothetical protein
MIGLIHGPFFLSIGGRLDCTSIFTFFTYLRGRRPASHIAYSIPHAVYTSHPLSFTDPPPTGYHSVDILLPDICHMYILPASAASVITDLLWLRHCTSFRLLHTYNTKLY